MKGPKTLLLLPGLDGTGDLFANFISTLPSNLSAQIARYPTDRFLTYDELSDHVMSAAPGHGEFVVVAESFSTPLAVGLAAHQIENLAGLVICAGFVTNPLQGWLRLARPLIQPSSFRVRPPRFLIDYLMLGEDPPPALRAEVIDTLRKVGADVIAARIRAVMACDVRPQLARVKIPMLYLQALNDRLVKPSCGEEVLRIRPETTLVPIPAPHLVLQRRPREAAEVITGFLHDL